MRDPFVIAEPEETSVESQGEARSFLRRVARSGMWTTLAFVVAAGGAFVVSIVVGRSTGPRGLGHYSYYTWLIRMLATVLAFGMPAVLSRFVSEFLGGSLPGRARGVWRLAIGTSLAVAPIGFGSMVAWAWWKGEPIMLALFLGAGTALTLVTMGLEGFLGGLREFRLLARVAAWGGLIQVAGALAGVWLGAGSGEFLALFVAGTAVTAGLLYAPVRRAKRRWPPAFLERDQTARVLKFAGMLSLVAVIDAVVWGRPEVFFLERYRSAEEVGFYGVGLKFAGLVVTLPAVASRALLPEFSWMHGGGRSEEFRTAFPALCRFIAFVAAGLALIGAAMSDVLVGVVYGPGFGPAALSTAVLVGGSVFGGVAGPVAAALFAGSREKFFVQAGVVLVAMNLVLDVVLIPRWGLHGAAIATIASQAIGISIGFFLSIRRAGLPYPLRDALKLVGCAAVAGAAGRALALLFSGAAALAAGAAAAGFLYLMLSDRSGVLRLSQLKDLLRKAPVLPSEAG